MLMSKRFLITLLTLVIIGGAAALAIFFAKGYTFSPSSKQIVGTGIISVTSVPDAASVYVDGHLTTATNGTVSSLQPGDYTVRVIKEGFIPWERKVHVNQGLVTDLKITLFPAIPTVYPLTFNGVVKPVMSPDGSKLAYIVPTATDSASLKKAGVWVWTLQSNQPISFARGAEPHQIVDSVSVDYSKASLRFSPDSKQILATVGNNNYSLNADNFNSDPRDITPTLSVTLNSWNDVLLTKDQARTNNIKDLGAKRIASSAGTLKWSPDETKFIFSGPGQSVKGEDVPNGPRGMSASTSSSGLDESKIQFQVYDLLTNSIYDLPNAKSTFWLPDSRHVVLVEDNQISIADFDGTNKAVIYAGNFDTSAVYAWPDSSRLMVVSSFPTPTASQPNFYGINLK